MVCQRFTVDGPQPIEANFKPYFLWLGLNVHALSTFFNPLFNRLWTVDCRPLTKLTTSQIQFFFNDYYIIYKINSIFLTVF